MFYTVGLYDIVLLTIVDISKLNKGYVEMGIISLTKAWNMSILSCIYLADYLDGH